MNNYNEILQNSLVDLKEQISLNQNRFAEKENLVNNLLNQLPEGEQKEFFKQTLANAKSGNVNIADFINKVKQMK